LTKGPDSSFASSRDVEVLNLDPEATERLSAWLDRQRIEVGEPLVIEPLVGGTSNIMYAADRGDCNWVLRRPPRMAIERANEGMRREFRILEALKQTEVPHPGAVALCDDESVLGCTFYLMQRVDGRNPMPEPPGFDSDNRRTEITHAMIDALVQVHEVRYEAIGLGDLGHPDRFHQRQVERWSRQLASYEGRELVGIDRVMEWLEGNRPDHFTPTLMHGDYHMRNTLIAPEPPGRVVAILDWETATIGDPLLDLAGFCEVWCRSANAGWPSRREIVERYSTRRGIPAIGSLAYYEVLYNFRLAVLVEGIFQRSLRDSTRPTQSEMGQIADRSVDRALHLIAGDTSE
jgi:aminoglycoside phosphotransferase (APT) family kinase protein